MTGCDRCADAVGHAFSALEPDEDSAVLDHLPQCAECRRALDEALAVVVALGTAVPRVEPPEHLRSRVLEAVHAEPALPLPPRRPTLVPAAPEAAPTPAPVAADRTPTEPPRPVGTARHRSWRSVAALAVAAVALGVGLIVARAALPTETGPTPESPSTTLADQADRVVDGAEARNPQVRHATLRDATGIPVAVVLQDSSGPRLVALGLPPADPAQDYVLWSTAPNASAGPIAVATIDPDDGITRPVATTAPTAGTTAAAPPRGYAVSVEPTGPVPARPSTVVAVGALV